MILTRKSWRDRRGAAVVARIERLNPNGVHPGAIPRGWNPHKRANNFAMDLIGVREFICRYGRPAYNALPKTAIYRDGHRKAVTRAAFARCAA